MLKKIKRALINFIIKRYLSKISDEAYAAGRDAILKELQGRVKDIDTLLVNFNYSAADKRAKSFVNSVREKVIEKSNDIK